MPKVGIVMGSDSDMPVMSKAADILEKLGIDYEMRIISAHREPDVFFDYAKTAEEKGFKVIIAGAGMAAHLPGMCAAIFPMPVIGIPMHTTSLGGRDSLYSIVQMPSGIPVATVAADEHIGEINNFDDFYHSVQLFLDLFERFIVAYSSDGHSGNGRILCSTNGEAVQVIAFAGEKSGNLGQNTYLVFYVEGNPSFFHAFICHWINLLLINNP